MVPNLPSILHLCLSFFRPDDESFAKKAKKGIALGYMKQPGPLVTMEWFRIVLGES